MFLFHINRFDNNEWFILITLIVGSIITHFLPKKYTREMTFALFLWGTAVAVFFDFTIGGGKFDFYIVNDTDRLEITDIFACIMFGYFNYFFIYIYESLRINSRTHIFYNLASSIFAVGFEYLMVLNKVFTYKNGYKIFYSFTIYLFMNSITLLLYECIKSKCDIFNIQSAGSKSSPPKRNPPLT